MKQIKIIHKDFSTHVNSLDELITRFDTIGREFENQDRNTIKVFKLGKKEINVKSFKIPNVFNQIVYRFFRKGKAQRSYEYANKLKELGIGTPQPIAYYEFKKSLFFKKSFYVSEQQDCDLTYRELTTDLNYPNHEEILRAFTRFTYNLHENNVLFLDHSPGNTLIKKTDVGYDFYLVDLNRMQFKTLDFETRIKNFSKLTIHKHMIEVMCEEYAKCIGVDKQEVFDLMWLHTREFQRKFYRKIKIKKQVFFWKKKYKNKVSKSPI